MAQTTAVRQRHSTRSAPPRRRSVLGTIVQVCGELLITAGVVLLLFVAWELWWTNIEANAKQQEVVESLAESFDLPAVPPAESGGGAPAPAPAPDSAQPAEKEVEPPVMDSVPAAQPIGIMYVPRFGDTYTRPIVSGVGAPVLDNLGLGHYPETAMPGAVGNFALAGHRQTHGEVLDAIHTLVPGDKLYVQTADGYYTYVFRNKQIVLPNRADVLLPVPTQPGAEPSERIMTLTSCNPRFGAQERIIAYSVMESWRPLSAGPPAAIADQVAAVQK